MDAPEQRGHASDLFVADAPGGLIQQQQSGFGGQRPGQLHLLLGAKWQRGNRFRGPAGQADELEHLHRALSSFRLHPRGAWSRHGCPQKGRVGPGVVADQHVLEHRHRAKEGDVLERAGQASLDDLVRGDSEHRLAVQVHGAAGRPVHAGDDVEEGRLACAVGADHRHDLTGFDRERDTVEGDDSTEAHAEVAHIEERHRSRSLSSK